MWIIQGIFPGPILSIELIPSGVTVPTDAVVYAGGYVSEARKLSSPNGVAGESQLNNSLPSISRSFVEADYNRLLQRND